MAIVLLAASALWAIASPLMSTPDEPAHAVRAAGIWQGVLLGERFAYPPNPGEDNEPIVYRVPNPTSYAAGNGAFMCFALKPEITADCAPPLPDDESIVQVETPAGDYPPLYYALIGWPSRLVSADVGFYVMRLVSAAIAVAFLALGWWSLRRVVAKRVAVVAMLVAATPQVLFLNGSISPNSLEVAAGFAVWTSLAALLFRWRRDRAADRPLIGATVVSAVVLANTRPLSMVFLAMIVAIVVTFAGWSIVRRFLGDRRSWWVIGAIAVGSVPAVVWSLLFGRAGTLAGGGLIDRQANALLTLASFADDWFSQMIAHFGWLDTGPVVIAVWVWLILVASLVTLAAGSGRPWRSTVLVASVAAVVIVPIVLQYPAARHGHVLWQGRYFLAIAVGVPVLAALTVDLGELGTRIMRRVPTAMAVLVGIATVACHMVAMRRYVVGNNSHLNYFRDPKWAPPVPAWLLLAMTLMIAGSVAVLVSRITDQDDPVGAVGGDPRGSDQPVADDPANETASDPDDAIDVRRTVSLRSP